MNTVQMRRALLEEYPSESWKRKVDKMPDAQVFAVYNRIKNNPVSKKWSTKK